MPALGAICSNIISLIRNFLSFPLALLASKCERADIQPDAVEGTLNAKYSTAQMLSLNLTSQFMSKFSILCGRRERRANFLPNSVRNSRFPNKRSNRICGKDAIESLCCTVLPAYVEFQRWAKSMPSLWYDIFMSNRSENGFSVVNDNRAIADVLDSDDSTITVGITIGNWLRISLLF